MARRGPDKLTPYQKLAQAANKNAECQEPKTPPEVVGAFLWAASKGALHIRDVSKADVPSATAVYFLTIAHSQPKEFAQLVRQILYMMCKMPEMNPPRKRRKGSKKGDFDAELLAASQRAREGMNGDSDT